MKPSFFALVCFFIYANQTEAALNCTDSYCEERLKMVSEQIEGRGVRDVRTLEAMRNVHRHEFVPKQIRKRSYEDNPLPIGFEQTISQPYIVAFMTEMAEIKPTDRVLEIGTGSGYQAAVLAEMAHEVYTIEILAPLAELAEHTLNRLGYQNINFRTGDGYIGWPEKSPFDVILVTAAPPKVPQELLNQLAEGGRMILPVGKLFQTLKRIRKIDGKIEEEHLLNVRFVPMVKQE